MQNNSNRNQGYYQQGNGELGNAQNTRRAEKLLKTYEKKIKEDSEEYKKLMKIVEERTISDKQIQKAFLASKYGNSVPAYLNKTGKFFDDDFKRKIVINLLKNSNDNQQTLNELIRDVSRRIEVHGYQIQVWVSAFRIVFEVQNQIKNNGRMTSKQKTERVNNLMLEFMQKNKNEKKYRLVKIIQQIFRNLNLPDPKASGWINTFVQENKNKLNGINFAQYNFQSGERNGRRRRKNRQKVQNFAHQQQFDQNDQNIFFEKQSESEEEKRQHTDQNNNQELISEMLRVAKQKMQLNSNGNLEQEYISFKNKRQIVQQKRRKKEDQEDQEIRIYPVSFKVNIANKIKKSLNNALKNAIQLQVKDLCLPWSTIEKIYHRYKDNSEMQNGNLSPIQKIDDQNRDNEGLQIKNRSIAQEQESNEKFPSNNNNFSMISNLSHDQSSQKRHQFRNNKNGSLPQHLDKNGADKTDEIKKDLQNYYYIYSQVSNKINDKVEGMTKNLNSQEFMKQMSSMEEQICTLINSLNVSEDIKHFFKYKLIPTAIGKNRMINRLIQNYNIVDTQPVLRNNIGNGLDVSDSDDWTIYENGQLGIVSSEVRSSDF